MPQIVYDLKGYPQFVYTAHDFAEQKVRKQPDINQLANLLIRSIFEDGGLGRVLSIDEVTPGTPANGWTIRFTGETNGRTADPYIAIYDGEVISYNDDPTRQPRDLSEGLALALEFAAKKDGQKNCNKGKPCGGSCIAKGRNCLKDKKDLTKNQQQATDTISKAEPVKPKEFIVPEGYKEAENELGQKRLQRADGKVKFFDGEREGVAATPLGQITPIKYSASESKINAIANDLKLGHQYAIPVAVLAGEDKYRLVNGGAILEAAKRAGLKRIRIAIIPEDPERGIPGVAQEEFARQMEAL